MPSAADRVLDAFVQALQAAGSSDFLPLTYMGVASVVGTVNGHQVSKSMLRQWESRAWLLMSQDRVGPTRIRVITYEVTDLGHMALEDWQEAQ